MEASKRDWELDELETLKSVLRLYHDHLEKMEEDGPLRYVKREEYLGFTRSIVHCLDISVQQTERMLGCVEQLVDSLSGLTDEIIELKNRVHALEEQKL